MVFPKFFPHPLNPYFIITYSSLRTLFFSVVNIFPDQNAHPRLIMERLYVPVDIGHFRSFVLVIKISAIRVRFGFVRLLFGGFRYSYFLLSSTFSGALINQKRMIMQNKPNLLDNQMNVKFCLTKLYEKE